MNMRKSKKGFTIVELVIVIAVIAILAAVLIPTFANLIRQANKSSDTQLVKNMNTILSAAEALNGKNETMADALQDILDAGYSVEKLTPTTEKCHIVWNQKTDRMIFLDENFEVEYPKDEKIDDTNDIWMVVGDKAALDAYQANYSIYLTEDFKEETVKVAHGLDVGSCKTIKTVECVNESYAGTILINMAGGNLTVNAPKATVNHYGDAALVEIEAVANASYHENGNVDEIRLKAGRVVVESKGNVAGVRIVADAISDGENGKKNVSVEVAAGGKLGAVGATNSTVAADLKNIVSGSTDVIESPVEVTNDFAGGFGTENSPYLIATVEQWNTFADEKYAYGNLNWRVISDLDFSGAETAYVEKFNGNINFNGHTLRGFSSKQLSYETFLFAYVVDATIENLNVYDVALIYETNFDGSNYYNDATTILKNVNTYGSLYVEDNNTTPFIFVVDSGKVEFNNCDNYMTVTSTGGSCAALYVGTVWNYVDEIKFIDCDNYGTLVHTAGYSSMLVSNGCSGTTAAGKNSADKAFSDVLVVSNCHNYGVIVGVTAASLVNGHTKYSAISYEGLVDAGLCVTKTPTIISEYNGKLSLNSVNGAVNYQITYTFWETARDNNDERVSWGSVGYSFKTKDVSSLTLNAYKFINRSDDITTEIVDIGDGKMTVATINGEKFYVFNPSGVKCPEGYEYTIDAQPFVSVIAYDAEGRILDMAVYKYADAKVN